MIVDECRNSSSCTSAGDLASVSRVTPLALPVLSKLNDQLVAKPSSRSPSPSYTRPGSRGTKQIMALGQSQRESEWVLCTGPSPCFAQVVSTSSSGGILIQQMRPDALDRHLLVIPESIGQFSAQAKDLISVQVRTVLNFQLYFMFIYH